MNIQINEKKVTLPESVHAYATKKVTKLDRYFRDDAEAFVSFYSGCGYRSVCCGLSAQNGHCDANDEHLLSDDHSVSGNEAHQRVPDLFCDSEGYFRYSALVCDGFSVPALRPHVGAADRGCHFPDCMLSLLQKA